MRRPTWLNDIAIWGLILAFLAIVVDVANPEIRNFLGLREGSNENPKTAQKTSSNTSRYTDLENLLKKEKWQEADRETYSIMRQLAQRKNLDSQALKKISCSNLKEIDHLWVEYSNKHFGFSVQKRIWQKFDGKKDDPVKELGNTVGWREKNRWKGLDEIDFNLHDAPAGHLPVLKTEVWTAEKGGFPLLFERCNKL
ncbi:MAG: GUN4 domain-containing protein [Xenococcus sp. MO_188.B8]|nr:GUN4 domain-containing protein [Xenococcus sp. MO_188.B8]